MGHYPDFEAFRGAGGTCGERVGDPTEFHDALGRIALGFSFLEDTARNVILLLADVPLPTGRILVAGLSFRQKVDALRALFVRYAEAHPERVDAEIESRLVEVIKLCRRSEQLRNSFLHSSFSGSARAKSANREKGYAVLVEPVDPSYLLDVADFISSTAMILEETPLLVQLADSSQGGGTYVRYFKGDEQIAAFEFGE